MHVLVTGGAGFIGAHTIRALTEQPRVTRITVLDDLSSGDASRLDGSSVELVTGSVLDELLLAELVDGADAVVHLAAQVSVPESVKDPISCFQVNVAGTVNLLEAVRVHGSRAHVVLASSAAVYGVAPQTRASETDPPAPASPYAASKLAAEAWTEAYSRCYGIKALVFRFFNVFGPLQGADHAYAAAVPALVEAALAGRPLTIHGDGRQTRDFVSVDDVASLLTTAVVDGVTSETPVNLAVGHHMSLLQLVEGIELVLEQHLERRHVGPRPGDVRHSQADISLLSELFPATAPTPFLQALTATVEWARSQPRLQG